MKENKLDRNYLSIVNRTIDAQMTSDLIDDYAFAPAIARSFKEFFLSYFNT